MKKRDDKIIDGAHNFMSEIGKYQITFLEYFVLYYFSQAKIGCLDVQQFKILNKILWFAVEDLIQNQFIMWKTGPGVQEGWAGIGLCNRFWMNGKNPGNCIQTF